MPRLFCLSLLALLALFAPAAHTQQNLLPDPSIEEAQQANQFGIPFKQWSGWLFEGAGTFRNGLVAHSGASSAELRGTPGVKMRLYSPAVTLVPGRYRFTCYIRGLGIGVHAWGLSEDVNFADETYRPLKRSGTFGWTRLTVVKDVPVKREVSFRIGLWAAGRLWVDDASLERVTASTPVTAAPVLGEEEKPIAPPGPLGALAVNCPDCGYRNMPAWRRCYACGAPLGDARAAPETPASRLLASFEDGKSAPFAGSGPEVATVEAAHATEGKYALRLLGGYAVWDGAQDWSGYDFLKADAFNAGDQPAQLAVEIHDRATDGYWTRVNYLTVLPPGASTLIVPTDLYVGEKSRPGRQLDKTHITRLVLGVDTKRSPVYFDNLRLGRDLSDRVKVPGLHAFSFGPGTSPPLRGFTAVTPATTYSTGRGYGLKNARIWKAYDALQPDPLYEVGICIEAGGFQVDLPNGRYHVFVNIDSPSGFWGEYQVYRKRTVRANGAPVVGETMDLERFLKKYFRFADVEDSLDENTFDKYQVAYFHEKEFDVDVRDGRMQLDFEGEAWANYVSALVIYPAAEATQGRRYLANLRERRRFYFDNYFKRVAPDGRHDSRGAISPFNPTPAEAAQGCALFVRDWMEEIPLNAVPRREEVGRPIEAFASAGEMTPLVFSVYPLASLGSATVSISDLVSASGATVPAASVRPGVVSHRLTRVTGEGTVYTIAPRFIMPRSTAQIKKGVTTTFWLTLQTPRTVQAGEYSGHITLTLAGGRTATVPVKVRLFAMPLDALDVPAGPWGSSLSLPWYSADLGDYDREMYRKSLAKMREYGCTTFSGIPTLRIRGWNDRKPDIDFAQADREMADAKSLGFRKVVVNYNGGIGGFDNYHIDEPAMRAAGFSDYVAFLRAVLTAVDAHARGAGWLPVAYNLCDEPQGEDAKTATANALAWRAAAPPGMLTTGATSVESPTPDNPHLALARALRLPNLNGHDEAALKAIKVAGDGWAFYNGGSRWTYGAYMFKCAQQYGMAFRLSWHWNVAAGDPYYALDSREDDYAWVATNANRDLIPAIHFERDIREGIDDYRYMLTLTRLLRGKPDHPAAAAARRLLTDKLAAFKLGERDHDAKWPIGEYREYRLKLALAIESLSR